MSEVLIITETGAGSPQETNELKQYDRTLSFGEKNISDTTIDGYFDDRREEDAKQGKRMYITIYPDRTGMRITYQNFTVPEAVAIEAEVLALAK